MNKYSSLVDELSDSHQGHESVLLSAVEHVVEKAVKAATSNIAQLIEDPSRSRLVWVRYFRIFRTSAFPATHRNRSRNSCVYASARVESHWEARSGRGVLGFFPS